MKKYNNAILIVVFVGIVVAGMFLYSKTEGFQSKDKKAPVKPTVSRGEDRKAPPPTVSRGEERNKRPPTARR